MFPSGPSTCWSRSARPQTPSRWARSCRTSRASASTTKDVPPGPSDEEVPDGLLDPREVVGRHRQTRQPGEAVVSRGHPVEDACPEPIRGASAWVTSQSRPRALRLAPRHSRCAPLLPIDRVETSRRPGASGGASLPVGGRSVDLGPHQLEEGAADGPDAEDGAPWR